MRIIDTEGSDADPVTKDALMIEFLVASLQGSAAVVATRHDCSAKKLVGLAADVARAAIEELRKNG